ncbi:unnamed protein product [Lymnaea stagnalis]|uniref:Transporter n=1 Tax=Lymnaea stagnalis TaxID=6523 RepID=A0AAV2HM39_LYMST
MPASRESSATTTSSSSSVSLGKAGGKDKDAREGWGGKLDFILTCIGYAVGLGNIWRFPYLCYKNGGGAFLIPYTLFLVLCGLPLFFLEVTYGQFSSLSPLAIWKVVPLFKGVGIGMICVSAIVCVYYNVIVAWTVYYLVMSFRAVLPWAHCDNAWNTIHCVDQSSRTNGTNFAGQGNLTGGSPWTGESEGGPGSGLNGTWELMVVTTQSNKSTPASEEFWLYHVLDQSDGINSLGTIRWQLLLCLAFSWLCVFFCLFKGVKILGKVMHFAAPFPYLVLIALLVRGCTLPGAADGIKFYIIPRWEKLMEFSVWGEAALQIFYSVGMAWGGIITMASYNKFSNNVYRDSMLVPLINCGTSFFAGFVIFSVLGFMAHEAHTSVDKIVTQGPGLTFVAYPQAIATMPISPLWSVLFFLMLFTIGLDSQIRLFYKYLFVQFVLHRSGVVMVAIRCCDGSIKPYALCPQGGIYVLQIMDWYCASFSLMLISLTECLALSWAYGVDNLYRDIALMTGKEPHFWWRYMWKYITPAVILFIWAFSVVTLGPVTYGSYVYPEWAIAFGWFLGVISVVPIPVVAVYKIMKTDGPFLHRVRYLLKSDYTWGPSQPEDRKRYIAAMESAELEEVTAIEKTSLSNMDDCDEISIAFLHKR